MTDTKAKPELHQPGLTQTGNPRVRTPGSARKNTQRPVCPSSISPSIQTRSNALKPQVEARPAGQLEGTLDAFRANRKGALSTAMHVHPRPHPQQTRAAGASTAVGEVRTPVSCNPSVSSTTADRGEGDFLPGDISSHTGRFAFPAPTDGFERRKPEVRVAKIKRLKPERKFAFSDSPTTHPGFPLLTVWVLTRSLTGHFMILLANLIFQPIFRDQH